MRKEHHSPIGFYTIGVAALFLAGFFLLVVFGAQSYRNTVAGQNGNMQSRALLSYLSTTVKACDAAGAVSLTEDPENELPVAQYLADRYSPQILTSVSDLLRMTDDGHFERSGAESRNLSDRDRTILKAACDYGKPLLDRTIDTVSFPELEPAFGAYLADELLQACRRKFYRPEYIACPGCGRTM